MKIITAYCPKPIAFRCFSWAAWYDDEPAIPIGYGATEAEAIADLVTMNTRKPMNDLTEDAPCPQCGKGMLEQHSHTWSSEGGPNLPDCSWLECDSCDFRTDPE
jgi:hypothetical protein